MYSGEPRDKPSNPHFLSSLHLYRKSTELSSLCKTSVLRFVVFSHLLGIEQISKASVAVSTLVVHVV